MSLSSPVSSEHLWKLIKQFPNTFIIHHWFPPTLSSVALCGNGFLYKSGNGKKRKVSIPWNYIDSGNSTENKFFFCFQRNSSREGAKVGQVVDPVWKQISLLYFLPIHHFATTTLSIAVYNLGHFVSKVDAAFQ